MFVKQLLTGDAQTKMAKLAESGDGQSAPSPGLLSFSVLVLPSKHLGPVLHRWRAHILPWEPEDTFLAP